MKSQLPSSFVSRWFKHAHNPLTHQSINIHPSLGPFLFLILSKFHPVAPPPPFKVHSSLIQGSFKVHSRFHSRLFLAVFKVVQGYSRLKSFSHNLENLDPLTGVSECPKSVQPQPNRAKRLECAQLAAALNSAPITDYCSTTCTITLSPLHYSIPFSVAP
jgi:hypothetical protein